MAKSEGVFNGTAYLAAQRENFYTYDILKIEANSAEFELVGKLKLLNSLDFTSMYLIRVDELPGNDVLLSFSYTKNNQIGKNTNFTYYVKTSYRDLGVITSTNQVLLQSNNIKIFPNPPVRQTINIHSATSSGRIIITDKLGRKHEVKAMHSVEGQQIDISGLLSVCYQLSVVDEQGYLTGTARFVKME